MLKSLILGTGFLLGQLPGTGANPVPQAKLLPPTVGVAGQIPSTPPLTAPAVQAAPSGSPVLLNNPSSPGSYIVYEEPKTNGEKKNGNGNGNGEEEKAEEEGPWRLVPDPIAGFKMTGFVYGTANVNAYNRNTRYNGPWTMSDQEGAFLNQGYLSFDRAMEDCFTVGGGLTFLYGNDYNASQSFGWELDDGKYITPATQKWNTGQDYGLAVPQLFAEFGTKKASLMIGHFWTPIGYCVVPANGNFFNTQPYSYMHGQPFDHWGAMAKFAPNDNWGGYLGVVNGWGGLDRQVDSASIIWGAKYTADEGKWYNNFQMYSGLEPENLGSNYANRTLVNNVTYAKCGEKIELVHEFTLGVQNNHGIGHSTYYGFSPYFLYKCCDNVKAGIRADIFRDPTFIVAGIRNGNPNLGPYNGTFWALNAGLNWTPNGSKNLMVRPEVRYDWFGGSGNPFDAGKRDDLFLFMLGAYYLF
jgi:hypothetical protein